MSRKPRSDSKLLHLPENVHEALVTMLLDEGLAYEKAKEKLHLDFNVSTSTGALGEFYRQVCAPLRLRRAAAAASYFQVAPGDSKVLDETSEGILRQKYFEILADPNTSPKELLAFGSMLSDLREGARKAAELELKRSKQETNESTLKLNREKFERDLGGVKKEVLALQRSIGSKEAPARVAKLVELIEAL